MQKARIILKEKGISHEDFATLLEITRPTMYKRFIDGKWKASQKKILKKYRII